MDDLEAIRAMVERSGKSMRSASVDSGRSATWLGASMARGSALTLPVAADLARVCGYTLALVPDREVPPGAIVIDPPAR